MNYKAINFRKEIQSISPIFALKAKTKKLQWYCQIDELIPKEFNTDPRRLKQILMNLISNSFKFTFKGYVKLKASFMKIEDKEAIKFSIIDTGLGIKKKDQKNLFTLFNTYSISKVNQAGTGIGLYQSYKLAKILGFKNDQRGI